MSKVFLALLSVLIVLFYPNKCTACDPGDSLTSVTDYIMVGDPAYPCYYTIYYCFHVDALSGLVETTLDHIDYSGCFSDVTLDATFSDKVNKKILEDVLTLYHGSAALPPPCSTHAYVTLVQIRKTMCWQIENIVSPVWINRLKGCGETGTCVYTYHVCTDYNFSPPKPDSTLVSVDVTGSPTCPTTRPQMPPPGNDWEHSWTSDCWQWDCSE